MVGSGNWLPLLLENQRGRVARRPHGSLLRLSLQFFFGRRERYMCVGGRQQFAHRVLALMSALGEPLLQVLVIRRGELREEESGASLIAGPDYIGLALKSELGSRQHTAKRHIRLDGHRLGGLQRKAVLSNVNADSGQPVMVKFEIYECLDFVTRALAPILFDQLSAGFQGFFYLFALQRAIEDAVRTRLEGLPGAGPCAAGDGQQGWFLRRWKQSRHANRFLRTGKVEVDNHRGALPVHDEFQRFLMRAAMNEFGIELIECGLQRSQGSFVVTKNGGGLTHALHATGICRVKECHSGNRLDGY